MRESWKDVLPPEAIATLPDPCENMSEWRAFCFWIAPGYMVRKIARSHPEAVTELRRMCREALENSKDSKEENSA